MKKQGNRWICFVRLLQLKNILEMTMYSVIEVKPCFLVCYLPSGETISFKRDHLMMMVIFDNLDNELLKKI